MEITVMKKSEFVKQISKTLEVEHFISRCFFILSCFFSYIF